MYKVCPSIAIFIIRGLFLYVLLIYKIQFRLDCIMMQLFDSGLRKRNIKKTRLFSRGVVAALHIMLRFDLERFHINIMFQKEYR